jgi:hypothetical protein
MRAMTIGVVLDAPRQERWVIECVKQALTVPGATLATLALLDERRPRGSLATRLHRLFDHFDERRRCRGERLLARADAVAELALAPLRIASVQHADRWQLDDAAVDAMRNCDVDLWLCFTAAPPGRLPESISRFGAWGLEVGDGVPATSAWGGAMEVGTGSPVTMISVVDYAATGDKLRYRSYGATAGNSPRRNRLQAVRKAMHFTKRLMQRLASGQDRVPSPLPATLSVPEGYPLLRTPTAPALARLSLRLISNWVAHRLPWRRRREQWQIAYYFSDEGDAGRRFERLRYLAPPPDRFWADPFAVERDGRYFIFFEELPYQTRRGHLMAIEVFDHAEPGEAREILRQPYHLSYPFVFDWEGALYMIPETMENRTVELYRCEEFPHRWRLHQVLLRDVDAVDATLWRDGRRWWMFVNIAEPGVDNTDELHLYWSATPLGPWTAHAANPVVSDVRCARSAGPLFSRDRVLFRPSQDCSLGYGHSVLINRVQVLNDETYQETAVDRIAPDWRQDIVRVHTVGSSSRLRVLDCMARR